MSAGLTRDDDLARPKGRCSKVCWKETIRLRFQMRFLD